MEKWLPKLMQIWLMLPPAIRAMIAAVIVLYLEELTGIVNELGEVTDSAAP